MPTPRAVALVAALALWLSGAACGGDDEEPAARSAGPTTTATAPDDRVGEGPAGARIPLAGFGEVEVRVVEGPDGEPIVLCVLLADTPEERRQGLMGVTDLGAHDGMLFTYEEDHEGGFWMRDTVLPLSIAYLDAGGRVVSTADMDPCPDGGRCPTHPPAGPFRRALEVPQGDLDALGLVEGSPARLEVGGACGPEPS